MERRFIRYCAFQEAAKESLRLPKKTESGNVWSIWYAAKTGDTERIGVLLSRGVSVNAPDEVSTTVQIRPCCPLSLQRRMKE